MKKIVYKYTDQFKKDFKKLSKKFTSLKEDLDIAKKNAIELLHLHKLDNQSIFLIPRFCNEELLICKIKKFSCKSLKGNGCRSGIRVVYAYCIKTKVVDFIEIYFKGTKENEDKDRIKRYLKFHKKV